MKSKIIKFIRLLLGVIYKKPNLPYKCNILEELQDRAAKSKEIKIEGLCQFTEYIRSLYPEYYCKINKNANKAEYLYTLYKHIFKNK